jgi:nitrate reductase NapD
MQNIGICGVLVHARPDAVGVVRDALQAFPGVEVHGANDDGRMVVTVEEQGDRRVVETITAFHDIKGVLSASIVYEHSEDDEPEQESVS